VKFDLLPDDQGWGQYGPAFVIEKVGECLSWATENEPTREVGIDYPDMVFLPLVWNLAARDYDMVVVDERQDMTAAQLDLAMRACSGRIVLVGDKHQAIYGFRGADVANGEVVADQLGAANLPLTVSWRCEEAIIRDAQRLVPHIQAAPGAGEGIVDGALFEDMIDTVKPGEFILSRLNAPLVGTTLLLLKCGTRARMAGRDIGQGILRILRRLKIDRTTPLSQVDARVNAWGSKERQRFAARGLLTEVARVQDTAGMLQAFIDDSETTPAMLERIEHLFTDEEGPYVLLSSVHKAKGLEADRVWILQESFYRFGVDEEEQNIEYVAITRAKGHLTKVTGVPSLQKQEWQQ
jgi:superfamily I DNA/RNA helicase